MPRFEERSLAFEFDRQWRVLKLDEHRDYRERMEKLDETKRILVCGSQKKGLPGLKVSNLPR